MAKDISLIQNFIAKHMYGHPFEFNISYAGQYTGTVRGSVNSTQTIQPGARQVVVNGFSGTLEAGTIIQFEYHKKLHTVTEDVVSGKPMKLFLVLIKNIQNG
ncbi:MULTISPECIES: hypothetical protein [Klebsiella]|uniref:hypothetical protein n=1 Tax=Klebsiella TaxID=570 RepID=UPI000AC8D367|nr:MULTISPECIES: hypothetical protein [Klebsiella]MDK1754102.1 hypothetical protein [Klebsiella sp. K5-322]MDK1838976.1 hypothetical protein [Klebsiella sp. K5-204]UPS74715.1 hypothetical protein M0M92_10860 [Klebsiella quasipneumoniae]HBQ6652376.1 hypothetical protein [Klebsiella quasipneumoniae subsp. quasipneumoniae]HBS4239202.1 hypothetical protein [Klebsiella quasipneumoniae subsp. quasipneumoniae]